MTISAFFLTFSVIVLITLDCTRPEEKPSYVPKRLRPHKSTWIKSMIKRLRACAAPLVTAIMRLKVRRRLRRHRSQRAGPRRRRYMKVPRDHMLHDSIPVMTTTWEDNVSKPLGKQFDSDSRTLMIDDGASACITNDKGDFIEPPKKVNRKVRGIKGHAKATHRGTIKWHVEDDTGLIHVMLIKGAYLIPEAATRILSPQHLAQQAGDHFPKEEGTGALTTSKNIMLFWSQRRYTKTVPLDPTTNVGLTTTAPGARSFRAFCATLERPETKQECIFTTHIIPDDEDASFQPQDPVEPPHSADDNQDVVPLPIQDEAFTPPPTTVVDVGPITHVIPDDPEPKSMEPQDELLRWHYRLGHLPFDRIKQLADKGQLPKRLLTCHTPFCAACQYGKMTKRPWRVKGDDKRTAKTATYPGQVVSVDQLESTSPGFIAQLKGALTQQRYRYATVFVDQFSRYTYVYLQKRITSQETVMAKHAFERAAAQRGVTIKHYHADNGRFADNAFIQDCQANNQILSYCGVNAHFQNGIAERRIRDLQERTRTSMLYAMNKWRKMVIINLWPYAMRHANDVANATPRKGQELSPLEMFSGVEIAPKLRHFHAFGCPTYVLDNALQSGQGAPKWKERSRLGVYLGPSPNHARSIALVLSPRTGHVSPQFHVKFDDFFETVQAKATDLDAPDPEWKYLSGFATKKGTPKAATKGGLDGLLTPRRGAITPGSPRQGNHEAVQPLDQEQDPPLPSANDAEAQETTDAHPAVPATTIPAQLPETPVAPVRQTRSGRVIKNTSRYEQSMTLRDQGIVAWELLIDQDEQEAHPTAAKQFAAQKAMEDPIAFAATTNPDILYWDQAMKAPDRDKFLEAVKVELDGHEQMGNYEPIPIDEVPKGMKLLDMVWSMRRKRRIKTQEVYKWKARLNVHGGQQEHGVHYWDTYAPVVTWQTVRFFLILSLLMGWRSRQLDFVMAYPQAPAEMPLYLRLPQGYKRKGMTRKTHVLKLKRNVYGQKQAIRVWNQYMDQGMKSIGFTPSKFDPCLYYRKSIVFLVYIDDCIVFGPNDTAIDEVVKDLRMSSKNFTIDDQGEVGDFLGIQIQTRDDGSIVLTQPQLIDSIIHDLHLQSGSNTKTTPAITTKLLHKDADGTEMTPEFHYRSVIGKLNFLEKSTRPDISVSVHQCARFTEHPKRCHGEAVKRIGRYLLGTRDKGIIINPNSPWHFDCWVDADYAGNWRYENAHVDPMTSKSRSGWIVRFAGAPITWASKMQTITALSTTEAEYIALSTSLREVIPLMGILKEAREHGINIKDIVRKLDLAMCVSPSSNGSKMRSLWTNQMKS